MLKSLLKSRVNFFADELKKSFKEGDEESMILILSSLSPCAIKKIGNAYYERHGAIIDAAEDASIFKFEDFLTQLLRGTRDEEDEPVNQDQVKRDVDKLTKEFGDFIKDKDAFIEIFTQRSFSHIKQVQ